MLDVSAAGFAEREKLPKRIPNESLWSDESDATLHASESGCKQSVGDERDENPDGFDIISEQSMENFVVNDESFENVRPVRSIPDVQNQGTLLAASRELVASHEMYADVTRAVECHRQAAQAGPPAALNTPGVTCENGAGVSKDLSEAVLLYRLAADQGLAAAQFNIGVCYEMGIGVEKDEQEAVRFYRLAADQGDADAQCRLGICYEEGAGVEKDEQEALRLYRLAVGQGLAFAQYRLGVCYAADRGYDIPQWLLGRCFERGVGVAKSLTGAIRYYRLSAGQCDAPAMASLGRLSKIGKI
jgi:TPR repeat protein